MYRFQGLLVFLVILLWSANGWGYSYMQGNPRWPFSAMPIKWYATHTSTAHWGGRTPFDVKKVVEDALNRWEKVDCSFIMFQYMGTTTTGAIKSDGKNVIDWVASLPGGAPSSAVGLGGPQWSNGRIFEGNVWIKSRSVGDKTLSMVITHEVGHALGFGHTNVANAMMYPAYNPRTAMSNDDRQAICNAYPISANTCAESAHCPNNLVCNGGRCGKCGQDGDCGGNQYCEQGACRDHCDKDDDCQPKGRLCINRRCKACKEDTECGDDRVCEQTLCIPRCFKDEDCKGTEKCNKKGRCVERGKCSEHKDCAEDEYCYLQNCIDKKTLNKVCSGQNDCEGNQDCVPHKCSNDLECHQGQTCSPAQICVDKEKNQTKVCAVVCKASGECPSGAVCKTFDSNRSFCYPKERKPPPPPVKKDPEDPKGCGCGADSHPAEPLLPLALLLAFFLLPRRRQRQR